MLGGNGMLRGIVMLRGIAMLRGIVIAARHRHCCGPSPLVGDTTFLRGVHSLRERALHQGFVLRQEQGLVEGQFICRCSQRQSENYFESLHSSPAPRGVYVRKTRCPAHHSTE